MQHDETYKKKVSVFMTCHCFTGTDCGDSLLVDRAALITIETKFIIVPFHIGGNHWCLVICDIANNILLYFDSIYKYDSRSGSPSCELTRRIVKWLSSVNVSMNYKNAFQIQDMSLTIASFPSQGSNVTECGVFVMMFADFFMNDLILDFTLRDTITFRKKIFLSLVNQKLNYSKKFYPIYESNKNRYIIKFQSLSSYSNNTVSRSICRELIDNLILFDNEYVIITDVIDDIPIRDFKKLLANFTKLTPIDIKTNENKLLQSAPIPDHAPVTELFRTLSDALSLFFSVISSEQSSPPDQFDIKYRLLKSLTNCPKEVFHSDCKDSSDAPSYNIQYSLIVAIQSHTKFVLSNKETIDIPMNGMIMYRGDYMHAGASYQNEHNRLFISCSNKPLKDMTVCKLKSN